MPKTLLYIKQLAENLAGGKAPYTLKLNKLIDSLSVEDRTTLVLWLDDIVQVKSSEFQQLLLKQSSSKAKTQTPHRLSAPRWQPPKL